MDLIYMILNIHNHLPTIIIGAQCLDLSALLIPVSRLHMIHQAPHPDLTIWAQLHPLQLFRALEFMFLIIREPPYLRDDILKQILISNMVIYMSKNYLITHFSFHPS